jgi:hypothetical protein
MSRMRKAVYVAVILLAVSALTLPLTLKAGAAGSKTSPASIAKSGLSGVLSSAPVAVTQGAQISRGDIQNPVSDQASEGKISPEVIKALGISRLPKKKLAKASAEGARRITSGLSSHVTPRPADGRVNATSPGVGGTGLPIGLPQVLGNNDALSAALITTIGGRDSQFDEVALIADWDGREDCVADRGSKIDDFSGLPGGLDIDFTLTRAAISEHTRGNGHPFFNVYYYGDSVGNAYMGIDVAGSSLVDIVFSFNVPELVNTNTSGGFALANPTANDCADDQVTVTGIAVNPVADLGDFDPGLCGTVGEVVYVSVLDTEGCASNSVNQPIRTRIFAFGLFEGSDAGGGFVALTNVRQVLRSKFANIAGVAVDDDGSLYYQLLDLIQFTGGAIFKATEICRPVDCGVMEAEQAAQLVAPNQINRVIPSIPDPPTLNSWAGTGSNPIVTANGVRNTNYSVSTNTIGNKVALATAPCTVIYAAVSRSSFAGYVRIQQITE